mmetsp:Transcript_116923/g.212757  ORF Transcript_116923/g.212757 Transcript_116923/m.212757 type:complete len:175 (-) Transcript_116923:145-669(-)
MPSTARKLTARARKLASAKGPLAELPPENFAAAVDAILESVWTARGIPNPVAAKIRDFAEYPHVWQDSRYFDCSLCGCSLPLAHTSLERHCMGPEHRRLSARVEQANTLPSMSSFGDADIPANLEEKDVVRKSSGKSLKADLGKIGSQAIVDSGPRERRWRRPGDVSKGIVLQN